MISKLRKLNAALKELGHRGILIKLDYKSPKTYQAVATALGAGNLGSRSVDVGFDIHTPLELTYVTYDEELKIWSQAQPGGYVKKETEFATVTFGHEPHDTYTSKKNPKGGQIEITEEFVDLALTQTIDKVKEKYRQEIIEELVNARLKAAGLV